MGNRNDIKLKTRWVIKIGSALLTNDGEGLHVDTIIDLATQIAFLRDQGVEVILVSSGSVAAGVSQLKLQSRPTRVDELQAAAAVGQASLVRHYEQAFQPFGIKTAQVLLTHADIANRERYLNARSTLLRLLELSVLTIVNENDTVATDEICFGDNDSLGALVANLVGAELMVILTDQDGLYSSDPRSNPAAKLISDAVAGDQALIGMASGGTVLGRGGMVTKLSAAQIASRSGATTIIANGREHLILQRLFNGEPLGTLLRSTERVKSKKQWMAGQMKITGSVALDDGAVKVLQESGRSLLPIGVTTVTGQFSRGELISCVDKNGAEIARGLSSYSAEDTRLIIGKASAEIRKLLPFAPDDELIHRDNLVLL